MKMENVKRFVKEHKAQIFSGLAGIGVVVSSVLALNAGAKLNETFKEIEEDEDISKAEKAKKIVPIVAAPVVSTVATVFCVVRAQKTNEQAIGELVGILGAQAKYIHAYKNEVIKEVGEEKEQAMSVAAWASVNEYCDYHEIGLELPDKKIKVWDDTSKNMLYIYDREITDFKYHFNRNFCLRGCQATLSDYCYTLGVKYRGDLNPDIWGWDANYEYYWVDFEMDKVTDKNIVDADYILYAVFMPSNLEEDELL